MKYAGMPMGMWALFAPSFRNQLTAVFGYDDDTAKDITKKARTKYRKIIADLPEFEKADRFKMNLVNCAMIGAFILSMPQRPEAVSYTHLDVYKRQTAGSDTDVGIYVLESASDSEYTLSLIHIYPFRIGWP